MPNVFFESAFEVPWKVRHALETKTSPCTSPPTAWAAAGFPVDLDEALRRFQAFHDNCIETVKAQKRRAAGALAHLISQHSDDIDAVFFGAPCVVNGVEAGVTVSFCDHGQGARKTLEVFTILRLAPDRFLTVSGTPVASTRVGDIP